MSVEDWAREQARIRYGAANGSTVVAGRRLGFRDGIVHAFSALPSDKAVEAAARVLVPHRLVALNSEEAGLLRAALQAAINAVTEGDTE